MDYMIDIETLSLDSRAVILSIGCCSFTRSGVEGRSGVVGRRFYRNIDIQSCLDVGLGVSGHTIAWWFEQSDSARNFTDCVPLARALDDLCDFLIRPFTLWAWHDVFDIGKLNDAYLACGLSVPWSHRDIRDAPTITNEISDKGEYTRDFIGTQHNALDDCVNQVAELTYYLTR